VFELFRKRNSNMTKNNSYDHRTLCGTTYSFSEIARKLGTGFASQTSEHDEAAARRWLFIMPQEWTWWVWLVTACLLLIGLLGMPEAFPATLLLSVAQFILFLARERAFKAFPVQLRLGYTLLLTICFCPSMRWLYWLPAVGTSALVIFGYCLMARMLSLLPWNRAEPITIDLLRRTFLSRPRLLDRADSVCSVGGGVGLCSIEAQVESGKGRGRSDSPSIALASTALGPVRDRTTT
jgi:hypothetical protein